MLKRILVAAALSLSTLSGASAQEALDHGWFVIVASVPLDRSGTIRPRVHSSIVRKVGRCGFTPFNDFSSKFLGFAPGYMVYVLGAFPTQAKADAIRRAVRPCIADAYVKFGRYAGE